MEGIALKPCPFCGGEAKLKAFYSYNTGFTIWCQCGECDAKTSGYCPDISNEDDAIDNIEGYTRRAVEKWNRRAGDTT